MSADKKNTEVLDPEERGVNNLMNLVKSSTENGNINGYLSENN